MEDDDALNQRPACLELNNDLQNYWQTQERVAVEDQLQKQDIIELAVEVVGAYVGNNSLNASDLPRLISDVHHALKILSSPATTPIDEPQKPAVSIRKSITADFLICLEDGKKFKSLKRHLRTTYDLSPDQYREKWRLPSDYPMVAPSYSATRSALAVSNGLGRKPVEPEEKAKPLTKGGKPRKVSA